MKNNKIRHNNCKPYNWLVYRNFENFLLSSNFTNNLGNVIYDLGAGESPYKEYLLKYSNNYIAVDWSNSFHEIKADIVADLNKILPIESEVCDTVISFSVIEHLKEPQMMLNEANRILKPGGSVILQVPWQYQIHEAPYDYFRYTPYGLKHIFEKAGFIKIFVTPQGGFFTMMVLKWNYFTKRLIRGPKIIRFLIKSFLKPFWYLSQKTAPWLDKLDGNWAAESTGYIVFAKKKY